ncbi:PGPGW domain-containing protein [Sphingopyxis flava]|nr:PGPGW domain-containing protein [Sphingopyxis flava]
MRTALALQHALRLPTSQRMGKPSLYQRLRSNAQVRFGLFLLGLLLIVAAPILGPLPGPGFIILFPAGLMLSLQNSPWAKRVYARFQRRHPRYAAWTDRIMRRASAARRRAREALEKASNGD